jgi:acyl carrier protein
MSNQEVAHKIKQFIATNFYVADLASLAPQSSFFEEGIVDSTGVLEVVNFLEETFGITVHDNEVLPENLDSLRGIIDFVERKMSAEPRLRLLPDEDSPTSSGAAEGTALSQPMLARDGNEPV